MKYLVYAACSRWRVWPWDFQALASWQQVELLAYEELLAEESAGMYAPED